VELLKVLLGAFFVFTGTMLFGLVHMSIAIHVQGYRVANIFDNLTWTGTWAPFILSIVQMLVGAVLIAMGLKSGKAQEETDVDEEAASEEGWE